MNATKLAEIKERAANATEGPWRHAGLYGVVTSEEISMPLSPDDAEFIAHARQDIPELLAEVERLQKGRDISHEQIRQLFGEVARLKRVVEFIGQHADDADIVRYFVKEALGVDD